MSRTPQTLTNTDLAFLLCTMTLATTSPHSQSQSQSQCLPKVTLSFETNYGLLLSLEPDDGSITISLRNPQPAPMSTDSLDPFDSATPIQSQQQQLFAFPSAPVSHGHGSIDGVLSSSPLRGAFGMMTMTAGTGGASITPARGTPSTTSTSRLGPVSGAMTRASKQQSPRQDMANKAGVSNLANMKIRYYIRPSGLDDNRSSSSHMYYTASVSGPSSTQRQAPHDPASNTTNSKLRPRTRTLHRVKLSHLQSLYHTHLPSSTGTSSSRKSTSTSWFDAYLDWIDRLDDAIALSRQRAAGQQQTPIAALPVGVSPTDRARAGHGATAGAGTGTGTGTGSGSGPGARIGIGGTSRDRDRDRTGIGGEGEGRGRGRNDTATKQNHPRQEYPFTDSGERSLWLVEGMLLASWLSLQEGVEGVEYLPLPHISAETESESGMEGYVYRLENLQGMEMGMEMEMEKGEGKGKGVNANNAGVMMKRLLMEVVRAGDME